MSFVSCNIFAIFGCQDTPGLKSTKEIRFSSRAEVVTKDTSASAAWPDELAELLSLNMEGQRVVFPCIHGRYDIWKIMEMYMQHITCVSSKCSSSSGI